MSFIALKAGSHLPIVGYVDPGAKELGFQKAVGFARYRKDGVMIPAPPQELGEYTLEWWAQFPSGEIVGGHTIPMNVVENVQPTAERVEPTAQVTGLRQFTSVPT